MPSARHLVDLLRLLALRLLVVCGLVGLLVPAGFASAATRCEVSCPCDDAADGHHADALPPHDDHDDHGALDSGGAAGDSAGDAHEHDDPCDECPEDCPRCECSPGLALAVSATPTVWNATLTASVRELAPFEAPAPGAALDVFRPPRSPVG